jgi:hypothetical protein
LLVLGPATLPSVIPFYPQCLQKAHENAALVDFDFDILQEEIFSGIRSVLDERGHAYGIDSNRVAIAIPETKLANATPTNIVVEAESILNKRKTPEELPSGEFWERALVLLT